MPYDSGQMGVMEVRAALLGSSRPRVTQTFLGLLVSQVKQSEAGPYQKNLVG